MFVTLTAPSFGPVHSRRTDVDGTGAALPAAARGRDLPRTASGSPAAKSTTRTTRASASRSARAALTTSTRCCGTRWHPSCGAAPRSQLPRELARLTGVSERRLRQTGPRVLRQGRRVSSAAARCTSTSCCASTARNRRTRPTRSSRRRPSSRPSCSIDARPRPRSSTCRCSPRTPDADDRDATAAREIRWGAQIEVRALDTDGAARRRRARPATSPSTRPRAPRRSAG